VIVVDASLIVWMLAEGGSPLNHRAALLDAWAAPSHVDLEVLSALRRYVTFKRLTPVRANDAVEDFASLPLERYELSPLLDRIWQLRHNLSPYDAAYVALAEALRAKLVTRDARLAAAPDHRANIVLVR
jgi:predicted nucleic acid-binding protein